jgi:glycosyltransferase involved in cell wall biosynthesis
MTIEIFAVSHNESPMMHYFLRHYLRYGKVTIFDNQSTDDSVKIAEKAGAIIYEFDTNNEFREDVLTQIRNTCWKGSKADWVIVTDIDELVYHKDLVKTLENIKETVVLPRMFNMYADEFPHIEGQIYDVVKYGVEFNSKPCLFRPSEIISMNYEPGCHFANPKGNYSLNFTSPIINLHFKNLSIDYVVERNKLLWSRQSEENNKNGWNWHTNTTQEDVIKNFEQAKTRLIKVV